MRILIVGAAGLGRVLATEMLHAGHEIVVLDADAHLLRRLPQDFAGRTVTGSPLDRSVLAGAADGCDAIACVGDDDNVNAVVAIAARHELHVPLALAVIANPRRADALMGLGAHMVCPTTHTAHRLHMALVRSGIETELVLGADTGVYRVEAPSRLAGRTLAEIERPGALIPVAVERDQKILLGAPELALEEGDVIHIAASHRDLVRELVRP